MKRKVVLIAGLAALCLLAADKIQPISAKLGLWEVTSTQQMQGMPTAGASAPSIPPDALAKMPPEQRARVEAMIKQRSGQPTTRTTQTCVTQEKLNNIPFAEQRESCTRTIVTSTSKMFELHMECADKNGMNTTADAKYEVIGDSTMKGTAKSKTLRNGQTMTMNIDLSGKWVSADCGTVK